MQFLICTSILTTMFLLFISAYQSLQIHCMKNELRKCMKVIARCRPDLNGENKEKRDNFLKAIRQIKKSLEDMEAW
ncbi:MAG: hypothetical protein LBJ32_01900 [Oscillospiraceae bacterium]|nr:hypothetical protein [Oscillospiraceae bacterium]